MRGNDWLHFFLSMHGPHEYTYTHTHSIELCLARVSGNIRLSTEPRLVGYRHSRIRTEFPCVGF